MSFSYCTLLIANQPNKVTCILYFKLKACELITSFISKGVPQSDYDNFQSQLETFQSQQLLIANSSARNRQLTVINHLIENNYQMTHLLGRFMSELDLQLKTALKSSLLLNGPLTRYLFGE